MAVAAHVVNEQLRPPGIIAHHHIDVPIVIDIAETGATMYPDVAWRQRGGGFGESSMSVVEQ